MVFVGYISVLFTLNTMAFGEEVTKEVAVVDTDDSKKVTISSNVMEWYAATAYDDEGYNFMAKYFLGYSEGVKGDGIKHFDSDHLVNCKPVTISQNYGSDYEFGPYFKDSSLAEAKDNWNTDKDNAKKYNQKFYGADWTSSTVSSNVFDLGDSTYLLVAYGMGSAVGSNEGTNVPVVPFNGLKYTAWQKNDGKTLIIILIQSCLWIIVDVSYSQILKTEVLWGLWF